VDRLGGGTTMGDQVVLTQRKTQNRGGCGVSTGKTQASPGTHNQHKRKGYPENTQRGERGKKKKKHPSHNLLGKGGGGGVLEMGQTFGSNLGMNPGGWLLGRGREKKKKIEGKNGVHAGNGQKRTSGRNHTIANLGKLWG